MTPIVRTEDLSFILELRDNGTLRIESCASTFYVGPSSTVGLRAAQEAIAIALTEAVERMRAR